MTTFYFALTLFMSISRQELWFFWIDRLISWSDKLEKVRVSWDVSACTQKTTFKREMKKVNRSPLLLGTIKRTFWTPEICFFIKKTMHHAHTHKISHMCGSKERQTRCHFMYSASSLLHKILFFFVCAEIKKWRFFTFYLFFFVFLINCIAYNVVCTWTNGNKKSVCERARCACTFSAISINNKK